MGLNSVTARAGPDPRSPPIPRIVAHVRNAGTERRGSQGSSSFRWRLESRAIGRMAKPAGWGLPTPATGRQSVCIALPG